MPDHFENYKDASLPGFEFKVPCRQFDLRPCVDLSLDDSTRYRTKACPSGECNRFPHRDLRDLQAKQQEG